MVYLELVDHDEIFRATQANGVVIANDLDITSQVGKEKLNRLIYNRYEGDSLNVLPACDCGHLKGGYSVGMTCDICKTVCQNDMNRPLESTIWIKAPDGIRALINPTAWIILSRAMTTSGFNLLDWLCNPAYKALGKIPPRLVRLENFMTMNGMKRGINSFYDNFDAIMGVVFDLKMIKESGPDRNDMRWWITENRSKIFSQYLPMPSKVGFVVESATNTTYIDKTITLAIDALRIIISINNSITNLTEFRKQVRVSKAIAKLAEYYFTFVDKTLGKKPGVFRKHVFGGRVHFSARAVISSISDNHRYDELYLPWSLSLQLFRVHLTSKLLHKHKMNPTQIEELFRNAALRYDPLLDQLFKEIIAEAPGGRIPVLFQRNPSLARGSAQLLYVSQIKTDPRINTISFSVLALKAPNADYDGDEMNLMLIHDEVMHIRLSRLAPHLGALDLGEPRKISGNLALPTPVVDTITNWMYQGR